MKHASDILLHFVGRSQRLDPVGQLEICLSVLREGLRFSPQTLDVGPGIGAKFLAVDVPAVCFADIPLRMSDAHVARYGTCAIGFTKALVKRWGGNPVLYMVDRKQPYDENPGKREDFRGIFGEHIASILRMIAEGKKSDAALKDPKHWLNALDDEQLDGLRGSLSWSLASHLKEMFDLGADVDHEDDMARRDRYYLEREWRVALSDAHKDAAATGTAKLIAKRGNAYYLIAPRKDVRVVVLPNDRCRWELHKSLVAEGWALSEMPALITYGDSKDL
jgi:hypothetical protein